MSSSRGDSKLDSSVLLQDSLLETLDGFLDVFAAIESAEAEIAFTAGAKTAPRRSHEMGLLEKAIEELPACFRPGSF